MTGRALLLTGITGNLGAMAALRFLKRGDRVYALVRSRGGGDIVRKRALRSLRRLADPGELPPECLERLTIVHADLVDEAAMMAVDLPERLNETWHFAASLKYMPKDRDVIFAANIDGLRNTLALHRRAAGSGARFVHISTAYLAGRSTPRLPEAPIPFDERIAFNNDYEKSKLLAEEIVLEGVAAGGLDGLIFRPSIVVGRRTSGRLVNYNGYYLGLRAFKELSNHLARRGQQGETVRLWLEPGNRLNLIPVDTAIDAMLDLSAAETAPGKIFNIVNTAPLTTAETIEILTRQLDIDLELCGPEPPRAVHKTIYEKLVAYSLTYTAPYMRQRIEFDTDRVRETLGRNISVPMYPGPLNQLNKTFFNRGGC